MLKDIAKHNVKDKYRESEHTSKRFLHFPCSDLNNCLLTCPLPVQYRLFFIWVASSDFRILPKHVSNIILDSDNIGALTQPSKTSFYYSFSLLPRDERAAMHSVYAFCRYADDIVDEDEEEELTENIVSIPEEKIARKRERLDRLRLEVERCYRGESRHPILAPLSAVVKRFRIPKQYFLTLLDGMEMDLVRNRYETFDELREYCYSVASVVGLICIEIFGYRYEETKEYAVDLGIALQLTNILRDVQGDASRGRIYLPMEDLRAFGYSEADLMSSQYNLPFERLSVTFLMPGMGCCSMYSIY